MKNLLFMIAIFCALEIHAQNYLISFKGAGESTSVNSVQVENLTSGTTLTLSGSDILRLSITTGVNTIKNKQSSELKIYPNPMTGYCILQIYPPEAGKAVIAIFDMTGRLVGQIQSYLEKYLQEFRLSGLKSGFYLISVHGKTYQYSEKLVCNAESTGTINIEKISNNQATEEKPSKTDSKGVQSTVDMAYNTGDRLKITGVSGIYSTVMTGIPESDKTFTFNFIACTDGENINYPVVEIGTQVWMAENLKTTKYKTGTAIPIVTDNTTWNTLTTPGYCWYNNSEVNFKSTYGALYNWYAVNTGNLCPTGWHVPTDAEWTTLTTYLGGVAVAGNKLKETRNTHWLSLNTSATNETGFTALPGGYRLVTSTFYGIGSAGFWWSASEYEASFALNRYLSQTNGLVSSGAYSDKFGFSVRCIRD